MQKTKDVYVFVESSGEPSFVLPRFEEWKESFPEGVVMELARINSHTKISVGRTILEEHQRANLMMKSGLIKKAHEMMQQGPFSVEDIREYKMPPIAAAPLPCVEIIFSQHGAYGSHSKTIIFLSRYVDEWMFTITGYSKVEAEEFDGLIQSLMSYAYFESNIEEFENAMKVPQGITALGASGSSGCFIATATYGNSFHPTVIRFQKFRDTHLANRTLGKKFIHTYYKVSPNLAKLINKNSLLRHLSKTFLDKLSRYI